MKLLNIYYRQNPAFVEGDNREPKLFATLKLHAFGLGDEVRQLPVYHNRVEDGAGKVRAVYQTCISGLSVAQADLPGLERTLEVYLGALIHFGRLPEYVFRVGQKAWPIYRLEDHLVSRYPGSAVYSAPTIGELRLELAAHFKLFDQIRFNKEMDILHLSRYDMQLYTPLFMLRAPALPDVPVFCVNDDAGAGVLIAPVDAHAFTTPLAGGLGILGLHEIVADYLISLKQLAQPADMSIRKLSAQTWTALANRLEPLPEAFAYVPEGTPANQGQEVPLFAAAQHFVAARTNRLARTALRLAPDREGLQQSLAQELFAAGVLTNPNSLALRPVATQGAAF